jgi:hypothetical protein
MRNIIGLSLLGILAAASTAAAQYPPYQNPYGGGGYGSPYGGGYGNNPYGGIANGAGAYRGPNAPLSPYLNLLNGGSPAANYYNFVRPNTFSPFRAGAFNPFAGGGGRQTFFPTLRDIDDDEFPRSKKYNQKSSDGVEEERVHMAPTGHPAAYGNTMGYFGLSSAQGGAGSAGQHTMNPTGGTGTPSGTGSTGIRR